MKRFTGFHRAALPIAAALIVILVASGPAAFGGFDEPLTLVSQTVAGNNVHVKIANSSSDSVSGQLWVEAMVDGQLVYGVVPVTVFGKQTASVVVGFPSEVEDVLSSGLMNDDPNPF